MPEALAAGPSALRTSRPRDHLGVGDHDYLGMMQSPPLRISPGAVEADRGKAAPRRGPLVFHLFGRFCSWRRVGAGAGSMLMHAEDGGVDRDVPVNLACGIGRGLDLLEQTLLGAVGGPRAVAFVDGLPRPATFWQITPLHSGPQPVQNPIDHLPVIPPPATTPIGHRQERPKLFPLGIRQITPPHAHRNDSGTE